MLSTTGSPRDPVPASRQIWASDLSKLQATLGLVPPTMIRKRRCSEVKFEYQQQQTTQLGEFTDFWYEPITSDNLPPAEENDVAVQDVTPVEVLEAEDDSNLANFQVRKVLFKDFFSSSSPSRPGSVWVPSMSMLALESADEIELNPRRELL